MRSMNVHRLLFLTALAAIGCGRSGKTPETPRPDTAKAAPAQSGYQAVEVTNGGTISGRVTIAGPAPQLPDFPIPSDAAACASASKNNRLESAGGGIGGAVIYLEGVKRGKPMPELPPASLVIDQRGCQYIPHVLAAPVGATVTFTNSDDVPHNVRVESLATDSMLMNRAQPSRGNRDPFPVTATGPASVGCDYHPWMSAYVFGVDNPYYAVTGADGSFSIDGVPPGSYRLEVWVNGVDARPRTDNQGRVIRYAFGAPHVAGKGVEVTSGGSVKADFQIPLAGGGSSASK
jgi:plastocyanin